MKPAEDTNHMFRRSQNVVDRHSSTAMKIDQWHSSCDRSILDSRLMDKTMHRIASYVTSPESYRCCENFLWCQSVCSFEKFLTVFGDREKRNHCLAVCLNQSNVVGSNKSTEMVTFIHPMSHRCNLDRGLNRLYGVETRNQQTYRHSSFYTWIDRSIDILILHRAPFVALKNQDPMMNYWSLLSHWTYQINFFHLRISISMAEFPDFQLPPHEMIFVLYYLFFLRWRIKPSFFPQRFRNEQTMTNEGERNENQPG